MDCFKLASTIPTKVVGQDAAVAPPFGAGESESQQYKQHIAIAGVTSFCLCLLSDSFLYCFLTLSIDKPDYENHAPLIE
eukprot:3155684-Rhodomonas_salina.1